MNNRQKMYSTNFKVRAWLKKNGYKEIHFFPHSRFSKDAFFQGLGWDGLASIGKRLVLFQTKTNCKCTKKTLAKMLRASESGVDLMWINAITRKGLQITIASDNRVEEINTHGGKKQNDKTE